MTFVSESNSPAFFTTIVIDLLLGFLQNYFPSFFAAEIDEIVNSFSWEVNIVDSLKLNWVGSCSVCDDKFDNVTVVVGVSVFEKGDIDELMRCNVVVEPLATLRKQILEVSFGALK